MANTWFENAEQRNITYTMSRNKTEVDFVLVGKSNRKYLNDVKASPWKLQHRQKKVEGSSQEQTVKRKVWMLKKRI